MDAQQLERYANLAPCFFAVIGVVFMAKCKVAWHPILNKTKRKKDGVFACSADSVFLRWASLVSHTFFIIGAVIFGNGILAISNVLGLPLVLGFWCASSSIIQSIGVGGVQAVADGHPRHRRSTRAARVVIAAVWIITTANYIVNRATLYRDVDETRLFGLMAVGVFLPADRRWTKNSACIT